LTTYKYIVMTNLTALKERVDLFQFRLYVLFCLLSKTFYTGKRKCAGPGGRAV
jgi:hypothetical protein